MAAKPPPKALPGFCPYCGYENPPTYRFCVSCRRRLPEILGQNLPKPGAPPSPPSDATPSTPVATPETGSPSPAPPRGESAPRGRPWILLPIAIVIIVVIALLGVQLLPVYLGGHPRLSPPPPAAGEIASLCTPDNGSNCKGASFALPMTVNSHEANTTSCDSFRSVGPGEILWMNYSASANIYAIVLSATLFGDAPGWSQAPFTYVHNPTTLAAALWFSGLTSGTFSESIPVPNDGGTYCIGWWEPSLGTATVTWLNDVNVTFD